MKNTCIIFFLLLGSLVSLTAQRIVVNPSFEVSNTASINFSKIELTDTETKLHVHCTYRPGWWISFSKQTYIQDVSGGEKLYPLAISGTSWGEKLSMPASGDTTVIITYPPLNKSVRKINFIEEGDQGAWNVFAISVDDNKQFFRTDTARIRGFLNGYDKRLGFSTGMIYMGNEITREDFPTVVEIQPDGSFKADLLINHPLTTGVVFENIWIPVYLEPGETLTFTLNWNDILVNARDGKKAPSASYSGSLARMNREALLLNEFCEFDYNALQKAVSEVTPSDYKASQLKDCTDKKSKLDAFVCKHNLSDRSAQLLKVKVQLSYGKNLLDYAMYREMAAQRDTTNQILKTPIDISFYDFLKELPLNDSDILSLPEFSTFINRYEYSDIFKSANKSVSYANKYDYVINYWTKKDSIFNDVIGVGPCLAHDVTKIRGLEFYVKELALPEVRKVKDFLIKDIKEPFLKAQANYMIKKLYPTENKKSYTLPKSAAANFFKTLVDPHKGNLVFVDFWGVFCGPCRAGIKEMKPIRDKYNDKGVAFVYITDEKSSPLNDYNKIMEDVKGYKHRLTADEYNYLRELFKFNGIPRYVLLDKNGDIIDDNYNPYKMLEKDIERLLKE